MSRLQRQLLDEIRILLAEFERDGEFIATTAANVARINAMRERLWQILFGTDYVQAARDFLAEFDVQADINADFYAASVGYAETGLTTALINTSKRQAFDMLLGGAIDKEFYTPIIEVINSSVSTGAGFAETVKSLRLFVEGGEVAGGAIVEGKLLRYVKQIASDSFALSDRVYNNNVSAELGLEFYLYSGGLIEDSRDFCKVRNGRYFHLREIEQWVEGGGTSEGNPEPNVTWQGQYRGTNSSSIFSVCGGYNCKHSLMPVSTAAVPVDVLRRNMDAGNFNPTEKQKKVLGLAG